MKGWSGRGGPSQLPARELPFGSPSTSARHPAFAFPKHLAPGAEQGKADGGRDRLMHDSNAANRNNLPHLCAMANTFMRHSWTIWPQAPMRDESRYRGDQDSHLPESKHGNLLPASSHSSPSFASAAALGSRWRTHEVFIPSQLLTIEPGYG